MAEEGQRPPKASRLIVTLHTDAGVSGHGEGSGGGADLFRKGFADLIIGQDPFMVGQIWEKMFAATYGREPSVRGWGQTAIVAAIAPVDAALYDLMAKYAGLPVYKFLGGKGLVGSGLVRDDEPFTDANCGDIVQYRRDEKHVLNRDYWKRILDFADRKLPPK